MPPTPPIVTRTAKRLYEWAKVTDDFYCHYFRILLVIMVSVILLTIATGLSQGGYGTAAYVVYLFAAALDIVILQYVGRLPTRDVHARFIKAFESGPWTGNFTRPKIKKGFRGDQMAFVMNNLENWSTALRQDGAAVEAVSGWRHQLITISAECL